MSDRNLDSYVSPYMIDSYGNEYDSYALAWRYLGIYMDCNSSSSSCSRKLLWAAVRAWDFLNWLAFELALCCCHHRRYRLKHLHFLTMLRHCPQYHDPDYSGGSIGEYQFYDLQYNKWDTSTCQTGRCAKMDCHDPSTHWKLVGVFKESVDFGNDNFFEQLYKHEGYCVWNGDKGSSDYEFMQNMREEWQQDCEELSGITDVNGKSYYVGTKPEAGGKCVTEVKCVRLYFRLNFWTHGHFLPLASRKHGLRSLHGFKL